MGWNKHDDRPGHEIFETRAAAGRLDVSEQYFETGEDPMERAARAATESVSQMVEIWRRRTRV